MTRSQIRWAQSHDWYVGTDVQQKSVQVCEVSTQAGKVTITKLLWFDDFKALRAWAGY